MKTYLAIYTGSAASRRKSGWDELAAAERHTREQKGISAWGAWMGVNAGTIAHTGGPLGKTKRVSNQGVENVSNEMAGVVILNANSHDEAAQKFVGHPHFTIFPGDAVEIMEILPMPGR